MEDKDREIHDLKERLARLEGQPAAPSAPPPPVTPVKGKGGCGGWVAGGLAVLAVLYFLGQGVSSVDGGGPANPSWVAPAGYVSEPNARGGGIATEWVKPTASECRGSGGCFAMNVITERDCPNSLYASITLLGSGGDNMGWTNDTAQGVQAGERTRLVFNTYERGVDTARIAEINCY